MTADSTRPRSLREVSRRAAAGEQAFDPALREFLDSFYSLPEIRHTAIADQPLILDDPHDAYLAAVAEHLAQVYGLDVPGWSELHGSGWRRPWFAGGLESLKATLFVQSPSASRRRLLFVSKDALSRPRIPDVNPIA